MPTPRAHGGAQLMNFPLTAPAFKGLNTHQKQALLGPEWATVLRNTVIDDSGRLSARKGWTSLTTAAHTARFRQGIEYETHAGTQHLIMTTDTEVMRSVDDGVNWTDVTGTAVFTDGNWNLVNFNDNVIGFQSGEDPLLYNGTTSSQIVDGGNQPTGGVGLSAFGRLWAVDADGVTLKYCALLNHTDWSSADAGAFDLSNVWPGTDTIQALAEYNGALVVFGRRNIVIYVDGSGSALGMDPVNMYIVDMINGTGCLARDSVQNVAGDLWFLADDYNLYSLGRIIQEKSPPMNNLTKNITAEIRAFITDFDDYDLSTIRSVYSPVDRFYLLFLPRESNAATPTNDDNGIVVCMDTRGRLEDGSGRCMGIWQQNVAEAVLRRQNGNVLWSRRDVTGEIGQYKDYTDNGAAYTFDYESGWSDLQNNASHTLILKRLTGLWLIKRSTTVVMKWGFNFSETLLTQFLSLTAQGQGALWGISEFGANGSWDPSNADLTAGSDVSEFAGSVSLQEKTIGGRGHGEFIKIGCTLSVDGFEVALQQLDLYAKVGRLR